MTREEAEKLKGRTKWHGCYLSNREIFERIQSSKEWRGAVPFENQTHWGLVLGTAHIAILKPLEREIKVAYMHGRKP